MELNDKDLINSAHDCSDGGLAVAIAEQCFSSLNDTASGAEIELNSEALDATTQLFSESPSRILITFSPDKLGEIAKSAKATDCPFEVIGKVTGGNLKIKHNREEIISSSVADLQNNWKTSLENQLEYSSMKTNFVLVGIFILISALNPLVKKLLLAMKKRKMK